jgi:hypothetical protein
MSYCIKYAYTVFQNRHIEPFNKNWVRVSTVYFTTKYIYNYKYYYINNIKPNTSLSNDELQNYSVGKNTNIICKPWYTWKDDNCIISRVGFSFDSLDRSIITSIRFLLIEYTHPNMKERIELEINNSWYITGNELLSFAMIMHLLEEQATDNYIFDKNYTIYIMDNKIRTYELKHNEYILLDKSEFRILTC